MIEWKEAPPAMTDIAKEIILRHHPELRDARIGFILRSEPSISGGRPVYSKTAKVDSKTKALLDQTGDGLDFIVWVSVDYWYGLESDRRFALIDHELCHCAVAPDGGFSLRGHDVEEFTEIIQRYGAWTSDLMRAERAFGESNLEHAVRQARMFEDAGAVIAMKPSQMAEVEP